MISNALYMSRLRGNSFSIGTIYGRAMSFDPLSQTACGTDIFDIRMLTCHPTNVAEGSSVPIFRGGPPIFSE